MGSVNSNEKSICLLNSRESLVRQFDGLSVSHYCQCRHMLDLQCAIHDNLQLVDLIFLLMGQ